MERMMTTKNYNRIALNGGDITDMEIVETYGLDPKLAGTPKINDAMLDVVYEQNVAAMIDNGMTEAKAKAEAGRMKAKAKHLLLQDLKKIK